jgi:hypothetical protein
LKEFCSAVGVEIIGALEEFGDFCSVGQNIERIL